MYNKNSMRLLERGLNILECFKENSKLSLTEVSNLTSLSPATCDRILKTLVELGYLERDTKKKFLLGDKMYEFLNVLSHRSKLTEIIYPYLVQLRDIFNETACAYIKQNTNRVCIASVESTFALRRTVDIGETLPLTQGAVGEVYMAYMDLKERESLNIKEDYSYIINNGFSENNGKTESGVYAIASPIFDENNNIICVISITGPSDRIIKIRDNIIQSLVLYSKAISIRLGQKN